MRNNLSKPNLFVIAFVVCGITSSALCQPTSLSSGRSPATTKGSVTTAETDPQYKASETKGKAAARVEAINSAANPPTSDAAILDAHRSWLSGAGKAGASFGCTRIVVEQQANESIADALKLFFLVAHQGECLLLYPVSATVMSPRYSFARGGQMNGLEIRYISDVATPRIWNSTEVGAK